MAEFLHMPLKTKLSPRMRREEQKAMNALARAAGHQPIGGFALEESSVIIICEAVPKTDQESDAPEATTPN